MKRRCVMLTDDQVKLLRKWGKGDVSAGLRWLINQASTMVYSSNAPADASS